MFDTFFSFIIFIALLKFKKYLEEKMKKIILIALFIGVVSMIYASAYNIDLGTNENAIQLNENSDQKLSMRLTFDEIRSFDVESKKGIFNEIIIPKTYNIGELGTPKLPAMKKLIEIPFGAEVSVNVLNYSTTEYHLSDFGINNPIIPVQPSLPKSIDDITSVEFEYDENYYSVNRFSDFEIATVEVLGVMRGIRLARLVVAPVNYNPVTGIIEVYNNIDIEVNFTGNDSELSQYIKASTYSPYFEAIYDKITNYRVDHDYPAHPDLTTYPVKYLIISHRMFESTLTDFIDWKTKKGFNVVTAYTDVIGTSASAIQTYVHAQYNAGTPEDPAPSFVLFVGDTGQVPASATGSSSGKATDLYYCSVDGDYFPEMYYGRMSATNTTQLQAQIDKILYYEKYEFADPSYLDNVTLIAGADATWNYNVGQPTINYGTNNYFNIAHGYSDINTYLTSYSGCYGTVDDGIGFINYTAHCSETSWGDPYLSQSNVNSFTNIGQYPLAIGNCCLAADFGYSECIGETWMRKANGGAVGYIGSSPSSYWFEDFYWSVGAFPIAGNNDGYVPTYEETTWGAYDAGFMSDYVAQDALVFVGNLSVTEVDIQGYASHASPLYYWQAYNTLGDPSLVIYNTQGSVNTVSFAGILPIGVTTFTIDAEAGSYVAISMDGILHGTALVDVTGSVDVPIIPFTSAGIADIVVTKPQYQPIITTVTVGALAGSYVSIESYVVSAGGDDVIEYGETVYLTVTLKNEGSDPATNVNMTFTESDTYITLTDNTASFGTIAAGASVTRTNAYTFNVSNTVPDDHSFQLNGTITSTEDTWTPNINLTAYAPVLSIQGVSVADGDNGKLDPNETANLVITIENSGGATANNIDAILSNLDSYITINDGSDTISSLSASSTGNVTFNVTAYGGTPVGYTATFDVDMTADNGYSENDSFSLTIGLVLEDFETGNFSSFTWIFGGDANWTIDTESPYEGTYSAKSGLIIDNQTSELILTEDFTTAGTISFYRKVSSESGYDYLKFFIDDILQEEWNGEVAWSEVSYPVTAGNRTFKWHYYKDSSISSGSDCAWIDYIILDMPEPADIAVDPLLFEATLQPGNSTSDVLTIGNIGGATLDYTARVVYLERNISFEDHNIFESNNSGINYSSDREIKPPIIAPLIKKVSNSDNRDCTFTIDLYDDYGDGWNGGSLDVMVNGSVVLDNITLASAFGPVSFDIPIVTGETISTSFTAGGWAYECSYFIYDNDGVQVVSDGTGGVEPTDLSPFSVTCTNDPILSWLTLDGQNQVSGSIDPGSSDDISVLFDTVPNGLTDGIYNATIEITSNDPDQPTITIPVTLAISGQLDAPINVQIQIVGTEIQLSWNAVSGATYYEVWSSTSPYSEFIFEATVTGATNWSESIITENKFYYVKAFN